MDKPLGPYDDANELAPVATGHLKSLAKLGQVAVKNAPGEPVRWALVE
jgi:hypothetical protein